MSFEFVIALVVTRRIFAYKKQATVLLQGEEMDILSIRDDVDFTRNGRRCTQARASLSMCTMVNGFKL